MCAALTELEERYQQLVEYLRDASYPTCFTVNQKRGLRQKAAGFVEKGGILFHRAKVPKGDGVRLRRVIIVPAEKTRLIRACHDGVDGGHFGRDKTMSKVC